MRINAEQEAVLDGFRCVRIRDFDKKSIDSISGPLVDGKYESQIHALFRSPTHLRDEDSGALASYVVTNEEGLILMFFSIRCGELFENVDQDRMVIGRDAYLAIEKLVGGSIISPEETSKAWAAIKKAQDAGMSVNDIQEYADKKFSYLDDESKEPVSEVSRVYSVHPGVELKFFGRNENARGYWKSLNMPQRMGETLFWRFVVPKLEELREVVGCRYLYLFAADNEADGSLVAYYKTVLHIDSTQRLSSNKPYFDFNSMFLHQEIIRLMDERDRFFGAFNPDGEDLENV